MEINTIDNAFLAPLGGYAPFERALGAITKNKTALCAGVFDSQKRHLAWALAAKSQRPLFVVCQNELRAREFIEDLRFFSGAGDVLYYPARDFFFEAEAESADVEKARFAVLSTIASGDAPYIVTTIEALLEILAPPDVFKSHIITIKTGEPLNLEATARALVSMGYERRPAVEGAGQFAIRGGILDVYPPTYDNPARVELWGDEVDGARLFDLESQRGVENVDTVVITPMTEAVCEEKAIEAAIARIESELAAITERYEDTGLDVEAHRLRATTKADIERLKDGSRLAAQKYISYIYRDKPSAILDYLSKDTIIVFDEPARIAERVRAVCAERAASAVMRLEEGAILPTAAEMPIAYDSVIKQARRFACVLLTNMMESDAGFIVDESPTFVVKGVFTAKNRIDAFEADLREFIDRGYSVIIVAGGKAAVKRLATELADRGIGASQSLAIIEGSLYKGFEYPLIKLAVISGREVLGGELRNKKRKRRQKGAAIDSFLDLRVGDFIVHDNHGVGVYKGIEKITVDGANRDFLKIEYAAGGALFVATDQLDMLQKYIGGGENAAPRINKLGGGEWARAKSKAKAAVEILAKDLIALYAQREGAVGHAFGVDTVWQAEFEETFAFEETEDQLAAIEDVKADMESPKVMDRLICGDVGYGKTEVALRAAFKAAQDGKQTAFLVPTTILAQQHYNTFIDRMKDYPVSVELLSRFRTASEQGQTLKNLKNGMCDIVIGTHRLLSKDVEFKDLGLVIVDEEQRFGVSHKDKLKKLCERVDCLTLTATPIPRTLHMSLSGIRDMSLLDEPPQERRPVRTYVAEYSREAVREAITREVARGGQVYYLHNRVLNIAESAAKVASLVPEAVVAYAHGQMSERELENVMVDFIDGDIDVLVCTTIIETGLDIPNVNTIIVADADFYGLSQLYQLRGRVGRSNRSSYAYLMYRKDKVLSELSEKRLQTIREFTEFGSGFKIAMRDLEIRGAGNLLGAQQHGHMDAVGYDMYCKLLREAVDELRGITGKTATRAKRLDTQIDINVNAYIPDYYIGDEIKKLDMYKRIALIDGAASARDVTEELTDRYGEPPACVSRLIEIALLKLAAIACGVTSVKQREERVIITFTQEATADPQKITALVTRRYGGWALKIGNAPRLEYKIREGADAVNDIREALENII